MTKARDLANVISGTGTLAVDAIPALPTSKITSGTFDNARLSAGSVTQHVDLSNLNADNLTSGTVPSARVSLSVSDIPNLDTAKITTGTFANARLSAGSVTQHVDLTALSADNLTSGTVPSDRLSLGASDIPNLDTAKITSGSFATARIPTLDGSKISGGTFGAVNGSALTSLPSSAPTTSQVTSAIAGTTASGVGAYGCYKVSDNVNPNVSLNIGNTYAGSNLWPAATGGEPQFSNQSGTFRLMGRINGDNSQATRRTSVWLRIS